MVGAVEKNLKFTPSRLLEIAVLDLNLYDIINVSFEKINPSKKCVRGGGALVPSAPWLRGPWRCLINTFPPFLYKIIVLAQICSLNR